MDIGAMEKKRRGAFTIFKRMIRGNLFDKVAFEKRAKVGDSHAGIQGTVS